MQGYMTNPSIMHNEHYDYAQFSYLRNTTTRMCGGVTSHIDLVSCSYNKYITTCSLVLKMEEEL